MEKKDFVRSIMPVETNIIILEVDPSCGPKTIAARLKEKDILTIAISPTQLRLVTHLDISPAMVRQAIEVIGSL